MRILLPLILLLLFAACGTSFGADVLILQSGRSPVLDKGVRGFRAASRLSDETVLLSDYAEVDVPRIVREERPRLVLAVGDRALHACAKVREVPVIALLALSLNLKKAPPENIGGIAMAIAPEHYMRLFDAMGAAKVGVLYDPKKTGQYLKRAQQEARQAGIRLVAEPVGDAREMQGKLARMRDGVDALWMLPDSTVVTTVNMEAFLLFAMAENVPAVTFTSEYLKNGAAAAIDIDPYDMGLQAAELAQSVLKGPARRVPLLDPRRTHLHTNENVLKKLGRRVP